MALGVLHVPSLLLNFHLVLSLDPLGALSPPLLLLLPDPLHRPVHRPRPRGHLRSLLARRPVPLPPLRLLRRRNGPRGRRSPRGRPHHSLERRGGGREVFVVVGGEVVSLQEGEVSNINAARHPLFPFRSMSLALL